MHMYGATVAVAPGDLRIYYACDQRAPNVVPGDAPTSACVATSTDGRRWVKPMMVGEVDTQCMQAQDLWTEGAPCSDARAVRCF